MSLSDLYLLRILQLEVYIKFLQEGISVCRNYLLKKKLIKLREKCFEERKQIRVFLNMTELWRLENV